MKHFYFIIILMPVFIFIMPVLTAQQIMDSSFRSPEFPPAFMNAKGPIVLVDVHHFNTEVKEGNYNPLFNLLEKDGFQIRFVNQPISKGLLKQGMLLVIINALAAENVDRSSLPVYPAFRLKETEIIFNWVQEGGSLLLVADHMPFPGATESLASRFGVQFLNGFAIDTINWDPLLFSRRNQTLMDHSIISGRNSAEQVDSVKTFWGQAFKFNENKMTGLLKFSDHVISYNPDTAWRFYDNTPVVPVTNWYQASAGSFGKGRVVILGEAGMLTAQLTGPKREMTGMNSVGAEENFQFILNLFRWLSFLLL
jgi:hypothetical protein